MKVRAQSPDGKQIELECPGIDHEFFTRIATVDLSEEKLRRVIEGLSVSADVKALLYGLASATLTVGKQILRIGRKILDFTLKMLEQFPKLTFFSILGAIVGLLAGSIPILGLVLGPVVMPLAIALGGAFGTLQDMQDHALERRIAEFHSELSPLNPA